MSTSLLPSKSRYSNDIVYPEVTITSFTETGQAESSIKVPLQRSYTGRTPVISSSLADTPCATLGIPGLLDLFNTILGSSYTLATPSLPSVLEDCIKNNYDFGTAYDRLRAVWSAAEHGTIQDITRRREADDRKMRQGRLVGNLIVGSYLQPRRVWDLYANRVVPWWSSGAFIDWVVRGSSTNVRPISHAWTDAGDRVDVQTAINGYEWPVLRGVYAWVDSVVVYLSGLGRPLTLKEGDLESDRCWFRRAWTLQEVGKKRNIAGDMPGR
ncbi:hypothetical protein F5146DRAFT_165506 [Armillaria mellea]|nr:hypothetical protein F5146DRAFT_165506 [Armillaria mellea]